MNADQLAKDLSSPGTGTHTLLQQAIGRDYFLENGDLDRPKLRRDMFRQPSLRKQVEDVTHPAVIKALKEAFEEADKSGDKYLIAEIPLLLEAELENLVDKIMVVDCPEDLQRQRVQSRDGTSADSVQRIMDSQVSRETRLQAADFIIHNDESWENTSHQLEALHTIIESTQ